MRIALFEPDIPQNTGTILRLCACLGVEAHIIEPAGFPSSDRALRRAGMDYLDAVALRRHASWREFESWRSERGCRLILFTTKATSSYLDFAFADVPSLVCDAMKANSNQAVIATLARLGAGADVVSGGELKRALAAGVPAQKIMFSGIGKTADELAAAI